MIGMDFRINRKWVSRKDAKALRFKGKSSLPSWRLGVKWSEPEFLGLKD